MSVIAITHHDENIIKIVKDIEKEPQDAAKGFKKTLRDKIRTTLLNKKQSKQIPTVKVLEEVIVDPCDFLKKQTGKPAYSTVDQENKEKHDCQKKPKLFPTKEDINMYNQKKLQEEKNRPNFIRKNKKNVLNMPVKDPEPKVVIDSHGEKRRLKDGLEPIYITLDTFGKTPHYLQELIKRREKLHQMQKDATGVEKPKCRYIRRDEREQLLEGLKHNWAELQQQYQGLPILTDTIPKIHRKSRLEAELKQLEKDIVLVERHPYIYVYDDNVAQFK